MREIDQRQRRCPAKGTVRLYCSWCCLRYHVPALSQAVHWRNWSKAFRSFRERLSFSGGLHTEPPLPGRWFPHGQTLQSTWPQPSTCYASVFGKASERRSPNMTTREKTAHFPAGHTSPRGLERWFQVSLDNTSTTCTRSIRQVHQRHSTRVR